MITVNQTIIDELNEVLDDLGDNKSIPPSYKKYKRIKNKLKTQLLTHLN